MMKLFWVGFPVDCPFDGRDDGKLVLAADETDARIISEATASEHVTEIPTDKACVLGSFREDEPVSDWGDE